MRLFIYIALVLLAIWAWPVFFPDDKVPTPATASYARLSGIEQQYYRQVFDYAMETVKPGRPQYWETASASGTIYASEAFVSASGSNCRSFSESFVISGRGGQEEGVACRRQGRAGWCRLRRNDALTCAFEPPADIVDRAMRETEDAVQSGKDALGKVKGWLR